MCVQVHISERSFVGLRNTLAHVGATDGRASEKSRLRRKGTGTHIAIPTLF